MSGVIFWGVRSPLPTLTSFTTLPVLLLHGILCHSSIHFTIFRNIALKNLFLLIQRWKKTSNMEKHNLRVFIIYTHSLTGAVSLQLIVTSDEKIDTLVRTFKLCKKSLPTKVFFKNGKEKGLNVVINNNCLCISYVTPSMAMIT